MPSALDELCGPDGPLQKEPPDRDEFAGLLRSGETRLADAQREENAMESRFDLAYNAAHALCLAALRHKGYRSSKRYVVFQVLPHTLAMGPEIWRVLDRARNARNISEYEGDLHVDDRLLDELIACAKKVLSAVNKLPRISSAR